MKIIGLTGGIGSGKTTVANIFAELGVPVYIADDAAKEVMASAGIQSKLREAFGSEIFIGENLDRKKLAAIVFSDKEKLGILNAIVHPAVGEHFKAWKKRNENHPIVIREAAILFESGTYKDCDKIITVTASEETRIERVMRRDNVTREAVLQRMENQWKDSEKMALSDFVIENEDGLDVRDEIVKILNSLKKL